MEIYLAIAAGVGGIASGVLGWLKSGEPFNHRKFLPTVLRSAVAGVGVGFVAPFVEIGFWPGIVGAFLTGAGFDVALHRATGSIKVN